MIGPVDAGRPSRMVPVGEITRRVVSAEVAADPCELPMGDVPSTRVHRHEMPCADVEAVEPTMASVRPTAEVTEIPGGSVGEVLVVARDRPRDVLEASPRRVVRGFEVLERPLRVLIVSEGEDSHRMDRSNQPGGPLLVSTRRSATRDVSRRSDDGRAGGRGDEDHLETRHRERDRQGRTRSTRLHIRPRDGAGREPPSLVEPAGVEPATC